MTLFREAIQEVQRACINGNLEKAKIILNEHINAHHKTEDDLLNMIRKLLCYQEHLIFANELLKIKETSKEDIDEELAKALSYLIIAEKNIKELIQKNELNINL